MVQCVPGALGDLVPVIDLRLYTLREKVGSLLRGLKKARARLQQDYDSTEYLQHHDSLCEEILTNTASYLEDCNPADAAMWNVRKDIVVSRLRRKPSSGTSATRLLQQLREELERCRAWGSGRNFQSWAYRKALLKEALLLRTGETASSAVDALVAFERGYLNDMLTDDPRCYNAWSHRGWLLMQFFPTAPTGHEERNQAEDPYSRASEYAITEQHVRDDPSNNSALEYRFLLIVSDVVFFSPGKKRIRKEGEDVVEDIGHDARVEKQRALLEAELGWCAEMMGEQVDTEAHLRSALPGSSNEVLLTHRRSVQFMLKVCNSAAEGEADTGKMTKLDFKKVADWITKNADAIGERKGQTRPGRDGPRIASLARGPMVEALEDTRTQASPTAVPLSASEDTDSARPH